MKIVSDIMTRGVIKVQADDTVYSAAKLMAQTRISCVLVYKENSPVGIVTERDMVRNVVAKGFDPKKTVVEKIMTMPIFTIPHDTHFEVALQLMDEKNVRRLIVRNGRTIEGVVTQTNILRETRRLHNANKYLTWHQNFQSYVIIFVFLCVLLILFFMSIKRYVH